MEALDAAFLAWGLVSAIAVIGVGAFSLSGGAARPRGAMAFGLFAAFWGLQIIAGTVASVVADADLAATLYLVYIAVALPTTYLLTEFAVSQAEDARRFRWRIVRGAVFAAALASALVLVFRPELLFAGLRPSHGAWQMVRGPLFAYLVTFPHFFAFGLTVVLLSHALRSAATSRLAERRRTLLAGIAIYIGFASANNLVYFLAAASDAPQTDEFLYVAVSFALVAVLAWIARRTVRELASAPKPEIRSQRFLLVALLVPMAAGLIEGAVTVVYFPRLQSVGLWRLAGVAVIAYGIARWRMWDLPQRMQVGAARAAGAGGAAATGAVAYGAASVLTVGVAIPAFAAVLVAGISLVPSLRFAKRFFSAREGRLTPSEVEAQLYGQRIDAYRAALEASLARGTLDEDRPFLDALRERFGISDDEERVLLHYARGSVIVPRDGSATDVFERLRLLGEGGAGRTWLARDRARDRLVVLKEPLERWQREPTVRDMVLREARLAARVRHPNVVRVEEVVESEGAPIIVLEYLEGGSLSDLLRGKGTLPWRDAVALVRDVLAGVEAVHAAGIVHRDVKPSNVLLDGDGTPKVADFGIAVPTSSGKTALDGLSTTGVGTLAYMAPEVRSGRSLGDRRSDVYACAAVLHECLYGAPPSPSAPIVVRGDVPAAVSAALARGLAERPEDRVPTARAFAELLDRSVAG